MTLGLETSFVNSSPSGWSKTVSEERDWGEGERGKGKEGRQGGGRLMSTLRTGEFIKENLQR